MTEIIASTNVHTMLERLLCMKIGGTFPLLGSFSILIRLPLTISMEFVTDPYSFGFFFR